MSWSTVDQTLRDEMARIEARFEHDREAHDLDALVGALVRNRAHNLRGRKRNYDHIQFVTCRLAAMVSLALSFRATASFRSLFKHYAKLMCDSEGTDIVSEFVDLYFNRREYRDERGAVVPDIDAEYAAEQLTFVFRRLGGDANASTNQLHGGGRTPLINAIMLQDASLVRVLLAEGAEADVASYNWGYPLVWAAQGKSAQILDAVAAAPGSRRMRLACRPSDPDALVTCMLRLGDYGSDKTPAAHSRLRDALVRHGICA